MPEQIILLADNHAEFLQTRAEFLERAGYRVYRAASPQETIHALQTRRIHLAVLDVRLENDDDDRDESGLGIALDTAYRAIPKIILTGFPSTEVVRASLRLEPDGKSAAVDYVEKKEGPQSLIRAVEQAFTRHVRINWDVRFRWTDRLVHSFIHLISAMEPSVPADQLAERASELEDTLRKLFFEFEQVTLGQVLFQRDRRIFLEALATSAERSRQFLVHCGWRRAICRERDRYDQFVAGHTEFGLPLAESTVETLRYAATAYTLGHTDLEEVLALADFYERHSAARVKETLLQFLQGPLATLHKDRPHNQLEKSLPALWREWLESDRVAFSRQDMEESLQGVIREVWNAGLGHVEYTLTELCFQFDNVPAVQLPNPLQMLDERRFSNHPLVLRGRIHGQPEASKIVVDRNGQMWLLDFTWSGIGPLVRDFAILENMFKFDLLGSSSPADWLLLEQRLLEAGLLDDCPADADLPPRLQKAVQMVVLLRQRAAQEMGRNPFSYLLALLCDALERINHYDQAVHYTRRELRMLSHALVSAAMVAQALQRYLPASDGLPQSACQGLWIDEQNQEAWVEGRPLSLTAQEYKVLHYLYKRAGKLCRRRAIIEEALGEPYDGGALEADRLNSLMRRLRAKVEPDTGKLGYLHTVRGEGYRLTIQPTP